MFATAVWLLLGMEQGLGTTTGPVYTQLHPATDCSAGCWKIVSTVYEGTNQRSALNHNIYVRMMWQNGTYVNSYPSGPYWTAFWGKLTQAQTQPASWQQ